MVLERLVLPKMVLPIVERLGRSTVVELERSIVGQVVHSIAVSSIGHRPTGSVGLAVDCEAQHYHSSGTLGTAMGPHQLGIVQLAGAGHIQHKCRQLNKSI